MKNREGKKPTLKPVQAVRPQDKEFAMKVQTQISRFFLFIAPLVLVCGISSVAQDGKLVIHVTPKQAYVFADGRAISEASKHHSLSTVLATTRLSWPTTAILRQPKPSPSLRAKLPTLMSR